MPPAGLPFPSAIRGFSPFVFYVCLMPTHWGPITKQIVMQPRICSRLRDEEGFATSRIEVKQESCAELDRVIRDKLPQPKQLIHLSRPQDQQPRVLDNGVQVNLLPECLHFSEQQEQEGSVSTLPLARIQFNGKGKTLFDYFLSGDFLCVYEKYKDKRPVQQVYYDFTSRIKIIDQTNDYHEKMFKKLKPPKQTALQSPSPLQFDSNFESGNTRYVYQQCSRPNNYYLLLENDTNTHGYNHWFFFRVRNKQRCEITLHIMNMIKRHSLYRQGMKIAIFSIKSYETSKRGWYRGGTNIGYNNTGIERTTKQNELHYCLSFTFEFEHENDEVYFALTVPYTYSRARLLFVEAERNCHMHQIPYGQKVLGYTLSNNKISAMRIGFQEEKKKRAVVVTARQHPCETMGSFVCEGFVKFLTSNSPESHHLLNQFNFVIIPMVNPDGVIEGNSRCNISGVDLNRQWVDPMKQLTPQTLFVKRYLQKLHQENTIQYLIDLHGHGKKMNSFFYCCEKKDKVEMRLFSIVMSKLCEQFDYASCTYGLTKDKSATIRGRFNSLGVDCYTLENSYFGWRGKNNRCYTLKEFYQIGQSIVRSLFSLHCSLLGSGITGITGLEQTLDRYTVTEEIKRNIYRLEVDEKINQQDSGSESDPDGDLFDIQERLNTLKMKSLLKAGSNQSILKGLSNVSKLKKYESPLVISHRKGLQKKPNPPSQCNQMNQTVKKFKRPKKGRQSSNVEPAELKQQKKSVHVVQKTESPTKTKRQRYVTEIPRGGRQMRLASSLNKPSRMQYFVKRTQAQSQNMTTVHSNQNLEQPSFVRKRPLSSSCRTQNRFVRAIKDRQSVAKVHTDGEQVKIVKTATESLRYQYKNVFPRQRELKVVEVSYSQQKRQRPQSKEGGTRSKEVREAGRSNLISDKFWRFQNFIDNNIERIREGASKELGNRVFYRFPVL